MRSTIEATTSENVTPVILAVDAREQHHHRSLRSDLGAMTELDPNFTCPRCGESFSRPVWECPECEHHSADADEECGNCHRDRPPPAD